MLEITYMFLWKTSLLETKNSTLVWDSVCVGSIERYMFNRQNWRWKSEFCVEVERRGGMNLWVRSSCHNWPLFFIFCHLVARWQWQILRSFQKDRGCPPLHCSTNQWNESDSSKSSQVPGKRKQHTTTMGNHTPNSPNCDPEIAVCAMIGCRSGLNFKPIF
jgi:hypothetical protein